MEKIYLVVDGSQSAPNIRHSLLSQDFPHKSIVEIEQSDPALFEKIQADWDNGSLKGVIVSGSPRSVYDEDATHLDPRIYELGVKKLLICYAYQDAAYQLGGKVQPASNRENGVEKMEFQTEQFAQLPPFIRTFQESAGDKAFDVVTNHGDEVVELWPCAEPLAATPNNKFAAAYDDWRDIIAVQPHFEISKEPVRSAFFKAFREWTGFEAREEFTAAVMEEYIVQDLEKNYPLEPGKKLMVALSGGVDSTATAAAVIKHYGRENVELVFVNTGLLRRDYPSSEGQEFGRETNRLLKLLRDQFGEVHEIDARERFIGALAEADGFDNPATNKGRRQIIGNLFADIFADWADERGDIQWFFQGTNQADKQESGKGKGKSGHIKTHHNEVPYLKERLEQSEIKIVEPLHWLYKNNIIELGQHLGLNMELYKQPPFPGPGLGVRIDGTIDMDSLEFTGICDAIVRHRLEEAMTNGEIKPLEKGYKTRQYFAATLNTAEDNAEKPFFEKGNGYGVYIDGEKSEKSISLYRKVNDIFRNRHLVNFKKWGALAASLCVLCNTITTTGQKGDSRVDGYQAEVRLFEQDGSPMDISYEEREKIANDLMNIKEITRVSYALTQSDTPLRFKDGKLAKVEINSVDTRDFTSFNSTDIPKAVLDRIVGDIQGKFGMNVLITAAFGGKPGRTTERH
ncbi:MAG: hypothetical protein LBG89_01280 [Rickettsiales bacterium]|jgi:GMP synthase (glutamine-hydrolysing)|nr:hypothetical protein [Rickettsiales bacterium]